MKWIEEILQIEPYKIVCKWNDNKIRLLDLKDFLEEKSINPENSYEKLLNEERFIQAKCDGTTIYWENGIKYQDYDGKIKDGPLDIAPEVLFELSKDRAEEVD